MERSPVFFSLFIAATACGGATSPAPSQPAPLVRRFEDAERWAKEFDDPARDAWQKPADVVQALNLAPGMTVADVGAGTGYFEGYLSRAVGANGHVLAVDIEPAMVRYLSERTAREKLDNVRPILADVGDPKLPPRSVDRILIVDTWHHIPNRAVYVAKLREALAPGGTLAVVDFKLDSPQGPPREHRILPQALVRELNDAGMAAQLAEISLPYQYMVVAR